jgi:hypothetical protein
MLPLLDRATGSWAAARPVMAEHPPGSTVVVPAGADAVARPDGGRDSVTGGSEYRLGELPGVWLALAGESVVAAWAVNAPAAASVLARLDRRGLDARLPGWPLHVTTDAGAWQRAVFRERLGRELWRPLLLALLLALLVEAMVAAAGRGRGAAPTATAATAQADAAPDTLMHPDTR